MLDVVVSQQPVAIQENTSNKRQGPETLDGLRSHNLVIVTSQQVFCILIGTSAFGFSVSFQHFPLSIHQD
jgi:hypothetical protein